MQKGLGGMIRVYSDEGMIGAFFIWVFPKIVGFSPQSSILIGFSITNHPFWGTPIVGNTHMFIFTLKLREDSI